MTQDVTTHLYECKYTDSNVVGWEFDATENVSANFASSHQLSTTLSFFADGIEAVRVDFKTGELQISAHMTVDDAAKLFWERVSELNPYSKQEVHFHPGIYAPEVVGLFCDQAEQNYNRAMKVVK
jgi:hypothetical protein